MTKIRADMMTGTPKTIKQIKQDIQKIANDDTVNGSVPLFWLSDWLLHVIDKPGFFLITDENYQLTEDELSRFNVGLHKMQHGTPLAYLTGQQAFWSLDFKVNEHTLIPRPDTEVLVEQTLNWIKSQPSNDGQKRLLDLGTGSGCIAVSLAYELQQESMRKTAERWQVVAVDLSAEALKVAEYNAAINNVADIHFIQSSWYDGLAVEEPLFDVIVSNPPYIDESDEHLARLVAEPISALSAPNHGLADIEYIVQQAPSYLHAGGLLVIEHGFDQGAQVRQLFLDNGFASVHTVKDYGDNDRVTLGQWQ
ncbi:peptide chain release factor N(5)-glutamine methyltransferase [Psychrobacter sp.]|uniref:peptide chain release factor N(5)-glutamine methyltransferase n=1 Tax=Psychrobacter sp. TaxID=56811 RepID=UPI0026470693|nr:peptide chain release factor N(5)-glutamine methyltransferase [Psychrobacter sp.]MDN6276429.1 peptide chain release factor N(5)-glutamine methyltransferase [Psychrobacter sp.]MDN6308767.1 peptide chain release factor N(5)-glutamine methyltransferase [Psychrobacter sp.]